jgi:hypothetical protein
MSVLVHRVPEHLLVALKYVEKPLWAKDACPTVALDQGCKNVFQTRKCAFLHAIGSRVFLCQVQHRPFDHGLLFLVLWRVWSVFRLHTLLSRGELAYVYRLPLLDGLGCSRTFLASVECVCYAVGIRVHCRTNRNIDLHRLSVRGIRGGEGWVVDHVVAKGLGVIQGLYYGVTVAVYQSARVSSLFHTRNI